MAESQAAKVEFAGLEAIKIRDYLAGADFDRSTRMGTIQVAPLGLRFSDQGGLLLDLAFRGNKRMIVAFRRSLRYTAQSYPNALFKLQSAEDPCRATSSQSIVLFSHREVVGGPTSTHWPEPSGDDLILVDGAFEGIESFYLYADFEIAEGQRFRVKIREAPKPPPISEVRLRRMEERGIKNESRGYSIYRSWRFGPDVLREGGVEMVPNHEWQEMVLKDVSIIEEADG